MANIAMLAVSGVIGIIAAYVATGLAQRDGSAAILALLSLVGAFVGGIVLVLIGVFSHSGDTFSCLRWGVGLLVYVATFVILGVAENRRTDRAIKANLSNLK